MAMETMYDHDRFLTAISNGLAKPVTLPSVRSFSLPAPSPSSSVTSLSLLPSPTSPPQLPSYPVLYAVVGDCSAASGEPPALVPLQIGSSRVKVVAESNPNLNSSIRVKYRTSWFFSQTFSSFILAVPVGFGGSLVSYEFTVASQDKSAALQRVELNANCKPHFQNIYLVSFRWVDVLQRYREIFTVVSCVQKFSDIDHRQGLYSFTVPLSIPSYVVLRPLKELQSQVIRLILEFKGTGAIVEHDISSHPLIELITDDRRRILCQESRLHSDKDLTCSFKVSCPAVQAKLCLEEASFIRSLEQGLKLTSGHVESLLPTAPVLFAVVSDINITNINTAGDRACQLPALVPLQMNGLSVKINAETKADSLCVEFKGRWSVQCIKEDNTSPLILAIPVGSGGHLINYEILLPQSPTVLKTEYTADNKSQFGNLYLVHLPPCKGGADICIKFRCSQDVIQRQGVFSFTVPLSVPKYVNGIEEMSSIKEKIRLVVECKDGGSITSCIVPSHDLMELISSEKMRVLVRESLGYSDKDLACEFAVAR